MWANLTRITRPAILATDIIVHKYICVVCWECIVGVRDIIADFTPLYSTALKFIVVVCLYNYKTLFQQLQLQVTHNTVRFG